jgi:CxxC motif-containing protein (DUF1111 family)
MATAPPPRPALSKDEVVMLREAREIRDMLASPGWKIYERIVKAQMAHRFEMVMKPAHDMNQTKVDVIDGQAQVTNSPLDGMSRFGAVEHIKGAYNGLQLALSTPYSMLSEADRLREEASPTEGEGE